MNLMYSPVAPAAFLLVRCSSPTLSVLLEHALVDLCIGLAQTRLLVQKRHERMRRRDEGTEE